jgi:CRP-like cAMP-binding protein
VSLFSKCCPEFLDSLSVIIRERSFAADEYIFHANEEASEMFYIRSGDVLRLFEVRPHWDCLQPLPNALWDPVSCLHRPGVQVSGIPAPGILISHCLSPQIPGEEPILDGKSTKGQCVGELSFFFRMRHLYSATACQTVETFTMNHRHFAQMLKMHPLEEDTVAQNALKGYDEVVSKAPSVATNSKLSVRSIGSALDNIIGLSVQRTISALKKQRSAETVDKAIRSAADGDLAALKEYMPAKVSVNSKNHDGRTCLHLAACNGHIHVMEYLLDEMGADTSVMDMYGNSPLNDAGRAYPSASPEIPRVPLAPIQSGQVDTGPPCVG